MFPNSYLWEKQALEGGGRAGGNIPYVLAMLRENIILPCYVGVSRPKEYGSFAVFL